MAVYKHEEKEKKVLVSKLLVKNLYMGGEGVDGITEKKK